MHIIHTGTLNRDNEHLIQITPPGRRDSVVVGEKSNFFYLIYHLLPAQKPSDASCPYYCCTFLLILFHVTKIPLIGKVVFTKLSRHTEVHAATVTPAGPAHPSARIGYFCGEGKKPSCLSFLCWLSFQKAFHEHLYCVSDRSDSVLDSAWFCSVACTLRPYIRAFTNKKVSPIFNIVSRANDTKHFVIYYIFIWSSAVLCWLSKAMLQKWLVPIWSASKLGIFMLKCVYRSHKKINPSRV